MTHEQRESYYKAIAEGNIPPIIGKAKINGSTHDIHHFSEWHEGLYRVVWYEPNGSHRRVSSFIPLTDVILFEDI